jgi:hypothetical protein
MSALSSGPRGITPFPAALQSSTQVLNGVISSLHSTAVVSFVVQRAMPTSLSASQWTKTRPQMCSVARTLTPRAMCGFPHRPEIQYPTLSQPHCPRLPNHPCCNCYPPSPRAYLRYLAPIAKSDHGRSRFHVFWYVLHSPRRNRLPKV